MGDHRANIKIEMEFHGVKDKCDMWINYFPDGCCNMDERVVEFFNDVYERGMKKYDTQMEKYYKKQGEEKERDLYEKLKKKFNQ